MANENPQTDSMKLAHVLFMDIVDYSKLPIDEQTSAIHILQELVNGNTQLSIDDGMPADERKAAEQLRHDILDANAGKLDNYVETANLMYVLGENLFCVSEYLGNAPK